MWGITALTSRLPSVLASFKHDIALFQRELISTLVTLEPWSKKPRVLDVDDAIYVHRNGQTAKRLARCMDHIICGNQFVADWFSQWNKSISIVPTAVDTERFVPAKKTKNNSKQLVIGWIGTSSNHENLFQIAPALKAVLSIFPQAALRIVSDKMPPFDQDLNRRLEFVKWSEKSEVEYTQSMTIGIMPLADSVWARGKCSFKMLQYMACGIPVVVSPVGMNEHVLAMGEIGMGATTADEWVDTLSNLLNAKSLRLKMGRQGRQVVDAHFSIDVIAPKLAAILQQIIS